MKKGKTLKGFTLLELIIVMAIFSGIMVGAIAMLRPVLKLHSQSALFEDANASIDNIRLYIEDNLRYADRVNVYKDYDLYNINDFLTASFEKINPKIEQNPVTKEVVKSYGNATPIEFFENYYFNQDASKYKDIYIMEVRNTAGYNDAGDVEPPGFINIYTLKYNTSTNSYIKQTPCFSINKEYYPSKYQFKFTEWKLNRPEVNIGLEIKYDGVSVDEIKKEYNIAFSFVNVAANSEFDVEQTTFADEPSAPTSATEVTDTNGDIYYNGKDGVYIGRPASSYKGFTADNTSALGLTKNVDGNIYIVFTLPPIIER